MVVHKQTPRSFVVKRRPDLSHQLCQHIIDLIAAHEMQMGDRLPTMKELAATFAVATPTIREAMRRLQAIGVIDIRHGSGIYVLRPEQGFMIANPHFKEMDAKTLIDLLDARLVIEPYLSGLAARSPADDAIAELRTILAEAEKLLDGQAPPLGTKNMRFHAAIAKMSGNRILAQVLESLITLYDAEQLAILEIVNARARDHEDHLRIFEAIEAHDADLAAQRMEAHITQVRAVIAERLQQVT